MVQATEGVFSTGVPYLRTGQGPPLLMASGPDLRAREPDRPCGGEMALSWVGAVRRALHRVPRQPAAGAGARHHDVRPGGRLRGGIGQDIGELDPRPRHVDGRLHRPAAGHRPSRRWWGDWSSRPRRAGSPRRGVGCSWSCCAAPRPATPRRRCLVARHLAPGPLTLPGPRARLARGQHVRLRRPVGHGRGTQGRGHLRRRGQTSAASPRPPWCSVAPRDMFYSEELIRRTADGIPGGRAVLFPGKSHMYVAGSAVPAAVALGFLVDAQSRIPRLVSSTDLLRPSRNRRSSRSLAGQLPEHLGGLPRGSPGDVDAERREPVVDAPAQPGRRSRSTPLENQSLMTSCASASTSLVRVKSWCSGQSSRGWRSSSAQVATTRGGGRGRCGRSCRRGRTGSGGCARVRGTRTEAPRPG